MMAISSYTTQMALVPEIADCERHPDWSRKGAKMRIREDLLLGLVVM